MKRLIQSTICLSLMLSTATNTLAAATAGDTTNIQRIHLQVLRGFASSQDVNDLQSIIKRDPNDPEAHFVIGEVLNALGFQNLAADQFKLACKSNQNYFLDRYHELLRQNVNYVLPITHFAVQHYPNDSAVLYVQGWYAYKRNREPEAAEFYRKALAAKPAWPGIYGSLAQLLYIQRENAEALKYAELALKEDPRDFNGLSVHTLILCERTGRPQRYIQELSAIAAVRPNNSKVQLALATGYLAMHEYDKAVEPTLLAIKYGSAGTQVQGGELLRTIMQNLPKEAVLSELDQTSPSNKKDVLSTLLRMRVAATLSELAAHKDAAKLLLQELQFSEFLAPGLNFRIAQELDALHDDETALYFYKSAHQLMPEDDKIERTYLRAAQRYVNRSNDLARRLKLKLYPESRS